MDEDEIQVIEDTSDQENRMQSANIQKEPENVVEREDPGQDPQVEEPTQSQNSKSDENKGKS